MNTTLPEEENQTNGSHRRPSEGNQREWQMRYNAAIEIMAKWILESVNRPENQNNDRSENDTQIVE